MFRRHKDDLPPAPPYKYGAKKTEPSELPPRIFDNPPQPLPAPMSPPMDESWNSEKASSHFHEEEEPETTLGEGVTFHGELKFERLLRIDGTFEGELISKGKVIVGPSGKVKANLNLNAAIIQGEVDGNITCEERLELRDEAVVTGDIQCKLLSVDEGVTIVGNVLVTPKESSS